MSSYIFNSIKIHLKMLRAIFELPPGKCFDFFYLIELRFVCEQIAHV